MLILYPATLLNLLISLSSFCMESIGFSIYSIMSSSYSDTFTTSLPIWIPFICFVCLIAVVRTSNTMLNKRVMRMGILVLFQIFFFFFLGPHPRHMEVPRLGIESELQLPVYATTTATRNPNCIFSLHCSSWQRRILNPLSKARDGTCNLMFLVGFLSTAP
uniref:Uncharacterized protein n=1 Tax=Sus scrofa TaxID=9823 RepID=A0A8D0ZHL9_PIG